MSPTRRDFLLTAGAAGAMAASLPLLLQPDGSVALPVEPAAVIAPRYGLPPTGRLEQLRCVECNRSIGAVLLDELDAAPSIACERCHQDAVDEAQAAQDDEDELDDFDKEALQDELEDEREAHEKLKTRYDKAVRAFDSVGWQLRDLETALAPTHAAHARWAERMREVLEGAVLPVSA